MRGWLICRIGSIGTMCRAVTELKRYLLSGSGCIAVLVLLCACATPYQPRQQAMPAGGYQEEQLDDGVYLVHFSGNGHSKLDTVIRYWNRRALELCPAGFTLLEQQLELMSYLSRLDKYRVIILDDIGYVRKTDSETQVLFEFNAHRYESGSLIITSNQPFSEWDAIFPDNVMTVAAIDRLIHHATIIKLEGGSYRQKQQNSQTMKQRKRPS